MKRAIQKYVQDPLAELLLEGKIHDGETVKITGGKDGLMFNGAAAKEGGLVVTDPGDSGQRTTERPSAITPIYRSNRGFECKSHPREDFGYM